MSRQFFKDADNLISINIAAIANGWTLDLKLKYIAQILPEHYTVKESKQKGNVHCASSIGIEDDEHWNTFVNTIKEKFKDFSEIFHNTCYNHVDFTIYFKKPSPHASK